MWNSSIFTSYMTIPFIIAGTLLATFLKGNLKYKNLFVFIDAIGLAAFLYQQLLKQSIVIIILCYLYLQLV